MHRLIDPKNTYDVRGCLLTPIKAFGIGVGLWVAWQFVMLFNGNRLYAENRRQINNVSMLSRAFVKYTEAHEQQFPKFNTAQDVTRILAPDFASIDPDFDEHGRAYPRSKTLEAISKSAAWNPALSGANDIVTFQNTSSTWLLYIEQTPDRFQVGFTDGEVKALNKERLNKLIGKSIP